MSRVLVVEDEQHIALGLRFNLEAEGYDVHLAPDGESALAALLDKGRQIDAVILDVMLPGIDGFAVAAELRRRNQFVPVLMLTARGHPEDVLQGFAAGADDYLPKPFELSILIARLGALVRRRAWHADSAPDISAGASLAVTPEVYTFAGKIFDFDLLELRTEDQITRLTLMEAGLLRYLLRHANRVVSRKQMLEDVWNLSEETDTRAIDNFIVRLRRLIEPEPARPRHLLTVRGVGYRFVIE